MLASSTVGSEYCALVSDALVCRHKKPRACMRIVASLKGLCLRARADEGMPIATRAVRVRIYRRTHDHDSQLTHTLVSAMKICRHLDSVQANAYT